ncbi:MAG: LacI family DNA-binding transcriptional regulator [Acidobacteriota bacterium]|nr:LacI family DNA-binding transcriptional regulator [Acidobacteriota bacterium]
MAVVRMKDIARELGVSVVTVSKALRNHDDISEETRGKVLQLMRDMNYRPNLAARALVTGRSYIVGFVVPGLLHSFFAEVAKGLTNVFSKNGYGLVIATSEEDPALERQEVEQLLARRVDALIVASTQTDSTTFENIEQQGIPYVLIDRRIQDLDSNFVGVDDQYLGLMATEHLIQCGCRRIAFLYGSGLSPALGRLEGYRKALEKHGLEVRPEYIRSLDETGDASDDAAYATMKELLALPEPPDGVFCFNDPGALNAMKAVLEAGLRIPEDVAVIGSGNIRHADFLRVPLTSIDQNSIAIGERAGKLALSLIESKTPVKPKTVLLEPRLVVRQSSMRIPGQIHTP